MANALSCLPSHETIWLPHSSLFLFFFSFFLLLSFFFFSQVSALAVEKIISIKLCIYFERLCLYEVFKEPFYYFQLFFSSANIGLLTLSAHTGCVNRAAQRGSGVYFLISGPTFSMQQNI